jgi:hypothetical protein
MTDTILITIPTAARFSGVATLVLGGIGGRLDLPYEQMDDLQLAVLSLLAAGSDDHISMQVDADGEAVSVCVGPLAAGSGSEEGLARVLSRLVDSFEPVQRDGKEWLTLRVAYADSAEDNESDA